nr:peptidase domain-containing protein [uncultured Methanoregula sp.]
MKVHWIVLLVVIGAAFFAPAVSAKIVEEKDGYIISTTNGTRLLPDMSRMSLSTITQGQTELYNTYVPSGKTAFVPYLSWGSLSNSLSLTITAPDSQMGPYYDSSDGVADGRINLMISRGSGLAQGTWKSYVYGYQVTGSQTYSYSATAN